MWPTIVAALSQDPQRASSAGSASIAVSPPAPSHALLASTTPWLSPLILGLRSLSRVIILEHSTHFSTHLYLNNTVISFWTHSTIDISFQINFVIGLSCQFFLSIAPSGASMVTGWTYVWMIEWMAAIVFSMHKPHNYTNMFKDLKLRLYHF